MREYVIGIDIGGTSTHLALVDRVGNISSRHALATQGYTSWHDFAKAICEIVSQLAGSLSVDERVVAIGLGAPNASRYRGSIVSAANLPWKEECFLARLVAESTGIPSVIDNDANVATIGEMLFGVAKGFRDFCFITLGTGIGAGIVANGQLLYGRDGKAGEVGHIIVEPKGRLCGCGRYGCLESYCSARGVVKTACELLASTPTRASSLRALSLEELTSERLYNEAIQGDSVALEAFSLAGSRLGETMANMAITLSPEAIVFFGGLTKAWDLLQEPFEEGFERTWLHILPKPQILLSSLPEVDAALLGAAALAWSSQSNVDQ